MNKIEKDMWEPWIDLLYTDSITRLIKTTPRPWRLVVALALAVAKWHPLRKDLVGCGTCGLCVIYEGACSQCPLAKVEGKDCHALNSLFHRVVIGRAREAQDKMFKVLYKLYAEEYEKVMS